MSTHNPLDIADLADDNEAAKRFARLEKSDLVWLMGNKIGRRIVHRLMTAAGVWRLSFHTNALQMAFNEGNRNYGLMLTAKVMDYTPEQYALMIQENRDNE